jgi:glutathione S-transferase
MSLHLYGDYLSQPSRAVFSLCQIEEQKVGTFEINEINIMQAEQFSPEYKKLNPTCKVPAIKDANGFSMFESHAIMKYLCYSRQLP